MQIIDGRLSIESHDLDGFVGGWCLDPVAMSRALPSVECPGDEIRVLEFGAGATTKRFAKLLAGTGRPWRYVSYENDSEYTTPIEGVEMICYAEKFPKELVEGVFDLVLIDGPHGAFRAWWYPRLAGRVREGTVMLLDDFDHCPEFAVALEDNFEYQLLDHVDLRNRPGMPRKWTTWKTVRVLSVKSPA